MWKLAGGILAAEVVAHDVYGGDAVRVGEQVGQDGRQRS